MAPSNKKKKKKKQAALLPPDPLPKCKICLRPEPSILCPDCNANYFSQVRLKSDTADHQVCCAHFMRNKNYQRPPSIGTKSYKLAALTSDNLVGYILLLIECDRAFEEGYLRGQKGQATSIVNVESLLNLQILPHAEECSYISTFILFKTSKDKKLNRASNITPKHLTLAMESFKTTGKFVGETEVDVAARRQIARGLPKRIKGVRLACEGDLYKPNIKAIQRKRTGPVLLMPVDGQPLDVQLIKDLISYATTDLAAKLAITEDECPEIKKSEDSNTEYDISVEDNSKDNISELDNPEDNPEESSPGVNSLEDMNSEDNNPKDEVATRLVEKFSKYEARHVILRKYLTPEAFAKYLNEGKKEDFVIDDDDPIEEEGGSEEPPVIPDPPLEQDA
ncbi:hypothetical protein HYFRA_00009093 [Hymenoscyphus fraxineus]|uniref:Uncharacterized protein n=1 Tax=Hymenoscyphus fraxineus TaxID=746836 RepID=A0A9N9KV11_9HELO|nr:hypothetical protein HYFRA_00009093 [Hymenoscyphus fraxineus]